MQEQVFKKITERVSRRDEIQSRIKAIYAALSKIPLQRLGSEIAEARLRLESLINQHGGNEAKVPEGRPQADLLAYKETHEKAAREYAAASDEDKRLRAELDALQGELSGLDCACTEVEVLEIQKSLLDLEGKAGLLRGEIEKTEKAILQAEGSVPDMKDLIQRREDLLADIATGQGVEEDLEALDKEIEKKKKEISLAKDKAGEISANGRQLIAGLRRRLVDVDKEIANIKETVLPEAVAAYLKGRAELIYESYVQSARELIDKHRQILGIGGLLKNLPGGDDLILYHGWSHFHIPGFALGACSPPISDSYKSIFGFDPGPGGIEAAAEMQRAEIRAAGIQI